MRYLSFIFVSCSLVFAMPKAIAQGEEFADELQSPITTDAVISPDETKALFVTDISGSDGIWILDLVNGEARPLVDFENSSERNPDWLPDGSSFVFSSNIQGSYDLWVANIDGGEPQKISNSPAEETFPRVSPDGSQIVYVSDETGKNEIWVAAIDGSDSRAIALNSLRVNFPDWSPDGQRIVYSACTEQDCNLFTVGANGFGVNRVTNGEFTDLNPDWGQDGIIFSTDRSSDYTLWLVQPNGSSLQEFSTNFNYADRPRWVDVGRVVATRSQFSGSFEDVQVWSADRAGNSIPLTNIAFQDTTCEGAELSPQEFVQSRGNFQRTRIEGITINGVAQDENRNLVVVIDSITQDEPLSRSDRPDAIVQTFSERLEDGSFNRILLKRERDRRKDDRVYEIAFTATDESTGATCKGRLKACVKQSRNRLGLCVDSGQNFDSTLNGVGFVKRTTR